jgi:hypothetical protein
MSEEKKSTIPGTVSALRSYFGTHVTKEKEWRVKQVCHSCSVGQASLDYGLLFVVGSSEEAFG